MAKRHYSGEHIKGAGHMKSMNHKHGVIHEDESKWCNLPDQVMVKHMKPREYVMPHSNIPDLATGVEQQLSEDVSDMRRSFGPKKY